MRSAGFVQPASHAISRWLVGDESCVIRVIGYHDGRSLRNEAYLYS